MSVRIMSAVWDLDLPQGEKIVLLALADHADDDGVCYPSIDRIGWKCGYSRSSVKRRLRNLQEAGVLDVVEPGTGRGNTTVYRVLPGGGVKLTPFRERGSSGTERGSNQTVKGFTAVTPQPSVEPSEPSSSELKLDLGDTTPPTANRDDFEKLWALAPGRGSKKAGWDQYRKAVPSKVDARTIHRARQAHVTSASGPKFVKHLERWVRDERWTDIDAPKGDPAADEWAAREISRILGHG